MSREFEMSIDVSYHTVVQIHAKIYLFPLQAGYKESNVWNVNGDPYKMATQFRVATLPLRMAVI